MLPAGRLTPYYDYEIMREYQSVLMRPKFKFSGETTAAVIEMIERRGYFVTAPTNNVAFADESDRKFYDVARFCGAALITGNERHFPREPFVMSPADFLARL
jgi:predicted nucleic acid-binding protein